MDKRIFKTQIFFSVLYKLLLSDEQHLRYADMIYYISLNRKKRK